MQPTRQEMSTAYARFRARFGQPVAGRSLYEYSSLELLRMIESSLETGVIDPQLTGQDCDLVMHDPLVAESSGESALRSSEE